MQFFNFRDGHLVSDHFSAPFRGLYLPNAWSQTLQTSRRQTFSLGFPSGPLVWDKTVQAVRRTVEGYLKTRKCCFLDLHAPTSLQYSGIFHDSTRRHIHSDGLLPKSRRSVVSIQDLGCVTSIRKKHSRSGLAWSRPRADRGLSRPTSVFHTNYRCVQNFIQIG